jgi:hypothetical protein
MLKLFAALLCCAPFLLAEDPVIAIDRLLVYKGTWKIETEQFSTPFSKAGKESSTLKNDCWRSGGFFACNQFVDGVSKDLIVFTYDQKNEDYNSYSLPVGGGKSGNGKLTIKDNVWTFPWDTRQNRKTYHFRIVNTFTSPGVIQYRQEFSEDNVIWTLTAKGTERRLDKSK